MHARVVSGTGGGPEKTILNSPRFLEPLGYRSVCVYLRGPADSGFAAIENRAAASHAPLIAVDDFGVFDWRIVIRLREIVAEHKPSIWHGHDYKSNLLGLLLQRHHPMRLVTTVHGWVQKTWKTPLYYYIDRQCLPRYDDVICVSQDLYDDCLRLRVPAKNLSLIDNAIALDDYKLNLTREEAKRELGVPSEQQLVVAVGRLSHEKGFDILIQAMANLIEAGANVGLAIAGGGTQREALERLIASTGHADRIRLLGFVGDPRTLYRAADLYTLSSRREGLPNVVLEAMAMGVPVVATEIAGMRKLIQHNVNGSLIPPHDLNALQAAIDELLSDGDARQRLSAAGRSTVEERFSFKQRMRKVAAIYAAS